MDLERMLRHMEGRATDGQGGVSAVQALASMRADEEVAVGASDPEPEPAGTVGQERVSASAHSITSTFARSLAREMRKNSNPLHKALAARPPDFAAARERVGSHPRDAQLKNGAGNLPLHAALFHRAPHELVEVILNAHLPAAREKTKFGCLPLEVARNYNAAPEIFETLEAAWPLEEQGLCVAVRVACATESFGAKTVLLATPEACQEKDEAGVLPLHYAVKHNAPLDVVVAVLAGYPLACQELCSADDSWNGGGLPLHVALANKAEPEVVRTLLAEFPAACSLKNSSGDLPLHIALAHDMHDERHEQPADVLHAVVTASLGVCREKDSDECLPLELAIEHEVDVGVIKVLLGLEPDGLNGVASEGATFRALLDSSASADHRLLARTFDAWMERYEIQSGPPVHLSKTAKVHFAEDVRTGKLVCLKFMHNRAHFEAEVNGRYSKAGSALPGEVLVRIIGWHTPADEPPINVSLQLQEREATSVDDEYPYVLVMERGERSLHDACAKERIAGYQLHQIVAIFRDIVSCVVILHTAGIVHGDLKQRNVLRKVVDSTTQWMICDMDAAAHTDKPIGRKSSSAYAPPELARMKFTGTADFVEKAEPSFDIWSLGVILFELCAGHALFAQDTSDDALTEVSDQTRLCTWHTMTDEELAPVLKKTSATEPVILDAKNLIRWCLKGDPDERPTSEQVLSHRFLCPDAAAPIHVPNRYHAFMSHAQADASGTAATLFHEYKKLGLHNWLDMKQEKLTLDGMRQGVRDSDIFLLVLSQRVLSSWFCQQEMATAIAEGKAIQLVLEEETRFHPFDKEKWEAQRVKGVVRRELTDSAGKTFRVPQEICQMVDAALPRAIVYRRRDFEQNAMMRELCRRNGVCLPPIHPMQVPQRLGAELGLLRVLVISNADSAAQMLKQLSPALTGLVAMTQDVSDLPTADRVLLLLSSGVLQPPSLNTLTEAIRLDEAAQQDRIVAVFSEASGWRFGCDEQMCAPDAVQTCLNEHEAICYRPKDDDGPTRHEFPAMVRQLLTKLGVGASDTAAHCQMLNLPEAPIAAVREQLVAAERREQASLARERELQAEIARLRAIVALAEGVPPGTVARRG